MKHLSSHSFIYSLDSTAVVRQIQGLQDCISTDAENISVTKKLSELMNNMVAEAFFITSFHLPCECFAESIRQKGSTGLEKLKLKLKLKRMQRGKRTILHTFLEA
jgi:hypothetical protein